MGGLGEEVSTNAKYSPLEDTSMPFLQHSSKSSLSRSCGVFFFGLFVQGMICLTQGSSGVFPNDNLNTSNDPHLEGVCEEVQGVARLCNPDYVVVERDPEANVVIRPVERLGIKDLSPIAKRE